MTARDLLHGGDRAPFIRIRQLFLRCEFALEGFPW